MKNYSIALIFLLMIVLLIVTQCERELTGWGDDGDIQVLADSLLWEATESSLRDIFEVPIETPQLEKVFTLFRGDLNKFKRYKNIIFISTLDGDGDVAQVVQKNLSPDAIEKIKSGNYVFLKKEEWASHQLILFLVSTDTENLLSKINENKEYLFNIFNDYWNETQKEQMYQRYEQKDVEVYLLQTYEWMVRVQHDYKIFKENADSNFIMLRRMLPERWLFVHWMNTTDPSVITTKWCIKKRNELGKQYYEGDSVEETFVQPDTSIVDFLGRRALRIFGLWRNDNKEAGGPFINYCFYDEPSQRIYMLDFAIFAPRFKKAKRQYLRQAEIILHTFKTNDEITIDDIRSEK